MHLQYSRVLFRSLLLSFLAKSIAIPIITFPINSQVPPVARVSKPFNFVFSASTFSTNVGSLQYSIAGSPAWLQLNSATRTLSGTPTPQGQGSFTFNLIATDDTGSASAAVTLVVSGNPGPSLGIPVDQQMRAFGSRSDSTSLALHPSDSIALSFGPDTFANTNKNTVYYAICANNTPLPSWIKFDPNSLSFSGSAPSFNSPTELPQDFGIQLVASDVVGFAGAVATFHIIVEEHVLSFGKSNITINVSSGKPVAYSGLNTSLTLDNAPVQAADLQQVQAEVPTWMSFDTKTLLISGIAPPNFGGQSFSVTATDIHGDVASTTVQISIDSSAALIEGNIGDLKAIIGSAFTYTFDQTIFAPSGLHISVDLRNTSSWLSFDALSRTLAGNVPEEEIPQQDLLNLTATRGSQSESQIFTVTLVASNISTNATTASAGIGLNTAASTPTSGPSLQPSPDANDGDGPSRQVVAAAAIISVGVVLIAIFGALCYRRRRRSKGPREEESNALTGRQMSRPILQRSTTLGPDAVTHEKPPLLHKRLPSQAPKVEIISEGSIPHSSTHRSHAHSLRIPGRESLASKHDSFQSLMRRSFFAKAFNGSPRPESTYVPGSRIRDHDEIPLQGGGVQHVPLAQQAWPRTAVLSPKISSYQPTRTSNLSFVSPSILSHRQSGIGHGSALFDGGPSKGRSRRTQRLSDMSFHHGIGHGRRPSGPLGSGVVKRSWRNPRSDSWKTLTDETGVSDISLSRFPHTPTRHLTFKPFHQQRNDHNGYVPQSTIRVVTSSPSLKSPSQRLSASGRYRDVQRTSPFFSAASFRRKSSHSVLSKPAMIPPLESSSEDQESTVSYVENAFLADESSAQRKGRMMQRLYNASSPPPPCALIPLQTPKQRTSQERSPGSLAPRFLRAPATYHTQSRASLESGQRFASAHASDDENGSWEDIFEEVEMDENGERKWQHVELPNPLGAHGSDTKAHRSLHGIGRERVTSDGGSAVLGKGGKRPVSIDSDLEAGFASRTKSQKVTVFL